MSVSHQHHPDHELNDQSLKDLFAHHGLRTTRQREVIYRTLCDMRTHPCAEELLHQVHLQDPEVSQATIYNTLDTFVECGLATRIPSTVSGGPCRYDTDTGSHVHIVLDDGRVVDAPVDLSHELLKSVPQEVLDRVGSESGIELHGIKIELFGRSILQNKT